MWWDIDLFHLFRWMLVVVCTVYATLQLVSSLWGWHEYLSPSKRETAVLRRYVLLQLLRLRVHRFLWELLQIVTLLGALAYLVWLHHTLIR